MKICICIPCVDKHIVLLENLLGSFDKFSRQPDEIMVSLSPKFHNGGVYDPNIMLEHFKNGIIYSGITNYNEKARGTYITPEQALEETEKIPVIKIEGFAYTLFYFPPCLFWYKLEMDKS